MVALVFRKIVQWMIIALLTSGVIANEELKPKCPPYRVHYCSCSIDEPTDVTLLEMCEERVSNATNCQPCPIQIQSYLTCDKCPENKCPICSVDDFGPQKSNNKDNIRISHPEQVFFTFSTSVGNILNVTPNPEHKILPHMSQTSFLIPKHATKGPKYFNNHYSRLISNQLNDLMKFMKYEILTEISKIYERVLLVENNAPDIATHILRFKRNVQTHGRFKRDEAEVVPGDIKGTDDVPREGVSKRPGEQHEHTSMNENLAAPKEGNHRHFRKFGRPLMGKTPPIRPKNFGDNGKMHTDFVKNMDMVPKANRSTNSPIIKSSMNYQDKNADLSNASLFKYKGNPSFRSQIRNDGDAFHTVRGDRSFTEIDSESKRYSRIKHGYSLSMPLRHLSTMPTIPHDTTRVKNSEELNNPDNHEVRELSRQDFSDNPTVLYDAVKGNGPGIMPSVIHETQLSESSLKPFSTDQNPQNGSSNLHKLEDFRSYLQKMLNAANSSDYPTDHDMSSKETPAYSIGENQTTDLIDQKVTGSHTIMTSHTDYQPVMSNSPATTRKINNDNESLNFGLYKKTKSSLPSLFTVQDTSEYATDQQSFVSENSEYTENQTHERKSSDMSTHLSDEQVGKTNLPVFSKGIYYKRDGDFRGTNDTSSHLRSTLFVQSSTGYVTPQHFINDETTEKSKTTEGTGTDTLENIKKSPYLQGQQRKQSGLPTLQEGENVNKDGNFSSTNDTGNHSLRTLAGQDTSLYRSDNHFDGSQTSEYIVNHEGTTGTNDMNGIDNLTTLSSDKPDQQLGGLNLPTIPNHENFGNEGIHFRMRSDSTIQFPISLLENAKNPNFHDDVTSEYKDEGKETVGTNDKTDILTIGSLSYAGEYPGQSNLKILEAGQPMVTNDIKHISKLIGLSTLPPNALLDSTAILPQNSETFDAKRGNINPTTPRASIENKHEISTLETRTSSEGKSKYDSSRLGYSNINFSGNDYSILKHRIGRKLLRSAETDQNKYEVTRFRISNSGRKRRLAKDYPENKWCTISGNSLYESLDCQIWTYQKICTIKCHENRYIQGESQAIFRCHRKKNVWEPKLQTCEENLQRNRAKESQPIEKSKVQEQQNRQPESKTEPKQAAGSEQQNPNYEYGDDDSQGGSEDYGEYEYATENSDKEVLEGDIPEPESNELDGPPEYSDEDDSY